MGSLVKSLLGRRLVGRSGVQLARSFASGKGDSKTFWVQIPGVPAPKSVTFDNQRNFRKFLKSVLRATGLITDSGALVTRLSMIPESTDQVFSPIGFVKPHATTNRDKVKNITVTYPDPSDMERRRTHTFCLANDDEFEGLFGHFSPSCMFPEDHHAYTGPRGSGPVFSLSNVVDGGHYTMGLGPSLCGSVKTTQNQ